MPSLPDLRENLKRHERMLREGAGYDKLLENDLQFHRIISNGCGNVLLQTIYDYLMDSLNTCWLYHAAAAQSGRHCRSHTSVIQALKAEVTLWPRKRQSSQFSIGMI